MYQINIPMTYPPGFLEKFDPLLNINNDAEYKENIIKKFDEVFKERFADKQVPKINPERIRKIADCIGLVALTALSIAFIAAAIYLFGSLLVAVGAIGSILLTGTVIFSTEIAMAASILTMAIKIGVIAAGAFGALSGLFYLFTTSKNDMYNNRQFCMEQAQKAISDFMEKNDPFDQFYDSHKELFDKGILKPEDINVLLKRKITTMNYKQVESLIGVNEKTYILFEENSKLVENRLDCIGKAVQQNTQQNISNLKQKILKGQPAVV